MKLLHQWFEYSASLYPEQIAIEVPPSLEDPQRHQYTYTAVNQMATHLALHLAPRVSRDAIVVILLPRKAHHIYVAQLAALKAGAAYTCLDPALPKERIGFVLQDTQAVAILTTQHGIDICKTLGFDTNDRVIDVADWIDPHKNTTVPSQPTAISGLRETHPDDLCYVIYTSGTTGIPKGVMIEHRSIVNLIQSNTTYFEIQSTDRVGQSASTSFDASVEEIYLAFAFGATLVLLDDDVIRLGPDLVPWLQQERISVISPTPTFLRICFCTNPAEALPDLRLVYVGGEALAPDLAKLWALGRRLENAYGPTECTVTVMRGRVYPDLPVTIGQPVPGNQAWVLDAQLQEVNTGQPGELCMGGIGLARGYLHCPDLTAEKFIDHPRYGRIYRTGDQVERLPSGEYNFLGRIDTQVKIRGYRIELEHIESALCEIPGVMQAACKVQGHNEQQTLVAFVVAQTFDEPHIRDRLTQKLPNYMIPTTLVQMERLPYNTSGKLERKALPDVEAPVTESVTTSVVAPRNSLETLVAQVFLTRLPGIFALSVHDDFFDLGGNSVLAAQAISDLRGYPETKDLTVRDLYESRTVAGLCLRIKPNVPDSIPDHTAQKRRLRVGPHNKGKPLLITVLQLLFLMQGMLLGSVLGYVISFVILPPVILYLGVIPFLLLSPVFGLVLLVLYAPLALAMTVGTKRLLIGHYRAGRHPMWSGIFLRHWMVQRVASLIPWNLVRGTVFYNLFLRILGVRIGKRVHLHLGVDFGGAWDLLTIEDGATIGRDVNLRVVDYEAQEIIFGPIRIGKHCTLGTRSGLSPHSCMEDNSMLTPLTMVPAYTTIPAEEMWTGVPASYQAATPAATICEEQPWSELRYGGTFILVNFLISHLSTIPGFFLVLVAIFYFQLSTDDFVQWLYNPVWGDLAVVTLIGLAVVGSILGTVTTALEMRLLGRIRPGIYSRWRGTYILIWIKQRMVERIGNTISGTLFWPWWLRLAGMKVGRDCEISTIFDAVPEQIEIGSETFFADGIYLGPVVDRGVVDSSLTTFGRHTFLGNHAVIPAGCRLPDNILIGVCTLADPKQIRPDSSWFGHPSFSLPRREVVEVDPRLTHYPPWTQYINRLGWEFLRFLFPILPLLMTLLWFKTLLSWQQTQPWAIFFLLIMPLYVFGVGFVFVFVVWIAKWLLLGKVKPGQHGLWTSWIYRWDFLYMLWANYARPILSPFHFTLVLSWWLRAMGAQVGKHVVLAGGFSQVVDPDMLHLHDDATVVCMFQAHSFEDRVLKLGHVHLRERSTVGNHAVVLYGADIGANTLVEAQSVVMKHEKLLPQSHYLGCPTQPVSLDASV